MEEKNTYRYNEGYQGSGISKDSLIKGIQKDYIITIDGELPNIDKIMKIKVLITTKKNKLIQITGTDYLYSLIIVANLKIQIEYLSDEVEHQVHTIIREYTISDYVTHTLNQPAKEYGKGRFIVEEIYGEVIDNKNLYVSILLLLAGEIY